jgi:hypothetical protein
MIVRIIAIRYDDCYIVSKLIQVKEVTLTEINSSLGKETIFDEFLVIDDKLQKTRVFNRVKTLKDEEEE